MPINYMVLYNYVIVPNVMITCNQLVTHLDLHVDLKLIHFGSLARYSSGMWSPQLAVHK